MKGSRKDAKNAKVILCTFAPLCELFTQELQIGRALPLPPVIQGKQTSPAHTLPVIGGHGRHCLCGHGMENKGCGLVNPIVDTGCDEPGRFLWQDDVGLGGTEGRQRRPLGCCLFCKGKLEALG